MYIKVYTIRRGVRKFFFLKKYIPHNILIQVILPIPLYIVSVGPELDIVYSLHLLLSVRSTLTVHLLNSIS